VWAVEGTGGYGAGLARLLAERGEWVVELDRPQRAARRHGAKSDSDAEAAARAALAGDDTTTPKAATGAVEMLRALRVARRSAVKARSQAANQLDSLAVTAPDQLRAQLRQLLAARLVEVAAALRPGELNSPWRRSSSPYASWHAATKPSVPRSTGSTPTSAS
jgi:transposase